MERTRSVVGWHGCACLVLDYALDPGECERERESEAASRRVRRREKSRSLSTLAHLHLAPTRSRAMDGQGFDLYAHPSAAHSILRVACPPPLRD